MKIRESRFFRQLLNLFLYDYGWDGTLYTPFDFNVCVKTLHEKIDHSKTTEKPIYGEIKENTFMLFTLGSYYYWLKWRQPFLYGKLIPQGTHTKIECYFGMDRFIRKYLSVNVAFLFLFFLYLLINSLLVGYWHDTFMCFLGIILIYAFTWIDMLLRYKDDRRRAIFIVNFLKETLQATEDQTR